VIDRLEKGLRHVVATIGKAASARIGRDVCACRSVRRVIGTLLSGLLDQVSGVTLWGAVAFAAAAGIDALALPPVSVSAASWADARAMTEIGSCVASLH
jgi:hypothetical protein